MSIDYKNSFYLSLAVHGLFFVILLISSFFDGPQVIRIGGGAAQDKPIIQADLIDQKAVKNAVARQAQRERDKQKQLALQKEKAEKLKQEVEKAKLEAQRLKQEVAAAQKKAEQEKIKLAQETIAKEKALAQQAQEKAALARKQAIEAEARQTAERAHQAQQLALRQQAAVARGSWLDSEFTRYVTEIERKIQENRTITTAFSSDLTCDIQIRLLPDGSVHDVRIIKSSGNAAYDSMSEAAVYRAAPFGMPEDHELTEKLRDIVLVFKVAEDWNG